MLSMLIVIGVSFLVGVLQVILSVIALYVSKYLIDAATAIGKELEERDQHLPHILLLLLWLVLFFLLFASLGVVSLYSAVVFL